MVVIIEGADALGKSTQINELVKEAQKRYIVPHILHYSNVKAFGKDKNLIRDFSVSEYDSIFKFMKEYAIPSKDLFIFDRCHLSEYVYSPMYREYDGYYVFASERQIIPAGDNVKLILFTDSAENVIERDKKRGDGLSFSLDLNKKQEELDKFVEAFNESSITDKKIITVGKRSIGDISKELISFVFDEADSEN